MPVMKKSRKREIQEKAVELVKTGIETNPFNIVNRLRKSFEDDLDKRDILTELVDYDILKLEIVNNKHTLRLGNFKLYSEADNLLEGEPEKLQCVLELQSNTATLLYGILAKHGELSTSQLRVMSGIERSPVHLTIDNLEHDGFVTSRLSEKGKRFASVNKDVDLEKFSSPLIKLGKRYCKVFKDHGANTHTIVATLAKEDPLTLKHLANLTELKEGAVRTAINRLEKRGLVSSWRENFLKVVELNELSEEE